MAYKHKFDYSITFACYNEVEYTKKCIDSMIENKEDLSRLIVVDNGSADGTQEYLEQIKSRLRCCLESGCDGVTI